MIKRGHSGGLISLRSLMVLSDRKAAGDEGLRLASVSLREAAKIGVQSLYADPEAVLERYKDFDIVQAMHERKNAKLLWVRARAIDADVTNANGDYFSKEEILADVEVKGKKIPAYKTFEGVPIYTNHKNDDIEQAKGMVVYAEWDEDESCVYCTFFIDEEAYPDIARGIRAGYMHDVSMGCQVESGTCSNCGNKATTEKDYCECLKKYKGKTHPNTGKKVFEKNHGLKYIELSVVGDGAFDTCEIEEIYDVDEILEKAHSLEKRAHTIHANIMIAEVLAPIDVNERREYENCLRQIATTTNSAVRLAQTAGTLVGGQVLSQEGAGTNSTVSNILHFLNIDPKSGLNILDLLNLSLNFSEVAVMNLFARKDNVDLSHVGKITKCMADMQSVMQDMIDDGVAGSGGGAPQSGGAPLNQGGLAQQPGQPGGQPAMAPPLNAGQPGVAPANYSPAGSVGRMISPMNFPMASPGVGGGVTASTDKKTVLVWASSDKDGVREVFASKKNTTEARTASKPLLLAESIISLADCLGAAAPTPFSTNTRVADNTQPIKINRPTDISKRAGGMETMDYFNKVASEQRKKQAASVTIDFKVEDTNGNRVVLSTADGSIKGYHKNTRVAWEPMLSDTQLNKMESGNGHEVAAQLLSELGKVVVSDWHPYHNEDEVKEVELDPKRTGTDDAVKEKLLGEKAGRYKRSNDGSDGETREQTLEGLRKNKKDDLGVVRENTLEDAGLYSRIEVEEDVKEHLLDDARKGSPEEVQELQLEAVRDTYGPGEPTFVVEATINALGRAVVASKVTPDEIVSVATKYASREDFAELIHLASLGTKVRKASAARKAFHKVASADVAAEAAMLHELGVEVSDQVYAADLANVIKVASNSTEIAKLTKSVTRVAQALLGDTEIVPAQVKNQVSREDRLRAALASVSQDTDNNLLTFNNVKVALSAMAVASQDMEVHPTEVVAAIKDFDKSALLVAVEEARTSTASEARLTARARSQFYNKRVASSPSIHQNVVGWLAEYAENYELPSVAIVEAAKASTKNVKVATGLVTKMIQSNIRQAGVTVTDEKTTRLQIVARTEDLGGLDPKDEGFEQGFKEKAIEILSNSGYHVDPGTFSLTELSVTESGDVTASVSTRFTKSFKADAVANPSVNPNGGQETVGDLPIEATLNPEGAEGEETPTLMTAAAKAHRQANRAKILERFAQVPPAMGGGGAGAPGADPMGMAGGGGADGLGMSGLTVPTEAGGNPTDEPTDTDAMPEPGTKKPWGSICPQCGSDDLTLANGEGECKSCGANLKFSLNVEVLPSSGDTDDKSAGPEDMEPSGADLGLGAATAPAPTGAPVGGGAAGGGAGAPPAMPGAPGGAGGGAMASRKPIVMWRTSYVTDGDVFIRTASEDFNRATEKRLPVGMICPKCGSRKASKNQNTTICYECGSMAVTKVAEVKGQPGKVLATITFVA